MQSSFMAARPSIHVAMFGNSLRVDKWDKAPTLTYAVGSKGRLTSFS